MQDSGSLVGRYQSDSIPVWVEWMMHLPWLKKKYAKKAVSELCVYEHGISLAHCHQQQEKAKVLSYKEIRRVWFERFQTGSEKSGHTAFRIDIIAENLDTLFSLTKTDCAPDDADLLLMEHLFRSWKAETWRHYHVVAAVVCMTAKAAGRMDLKSPEEPVYLCMQKPHTRYDYTSYHWEFPGGKVEAEESEPDALKRELREEMDYQVTVKDHLITVDHAYRDFAITLSCYLCSAESPDFIRKEHLDHRWLTIDEMQNLDWCAADAPVLKSIYELNGMR